MEELMNFILSRKVTNVKEILPTDLIITHEVRNYCIENKCGKYNKNLMCPPFVGSVKEFIQKLKDYKLGFLVLLNDKVNNPERLNDFYYAADRLHEIMIDIENKGKELGFFNSTALIGGNCRLCKTCNAALGKITCIHPDKARPSLEAMGIDVINTCETLGITIEFKEDEVTWVGLLLI